MTSERLDRVVLDTNLLVAAAYNSGSASRAVVEACLRGDLTAFLSPAIKDEYGLILARAVRERNYGGRLQQFVERAELVHPAHTPRVVPDDPGDDKLVAATLAAAAVLVSNDHHLLAVAGHRGLRVLRPAELVKLLSRS